MLAMGCVAAPNLPLPFCREKFIARVDTIAGKPRSHRSMLGSIHNPQLRYLQRCAGIAYSRA
ncbi:hypothetical protein PCAU_0710 [Pseudomonas chlororaphis subsp. aurantiaca]|nr:hypothetical protein PCAU_0710 [Pseudomonas chlororaphis subsp. aurantiaca]